MNVESHEHARTLLTAARVEGISLDDRQWLEAHLAGCIECSHEAKALAVAVESLRALNVRASPDVVRRTSLAIHRRAGRRRVEREPAGLLWSAAAISSACTVATTPYTWAFFVWFGRAFHLPDMIWQSGFLVWWFLPATVLSAVAAWHHIVTRKTVSTWPMEISL